MTELISHSTPKARQRHRCHACWHDIVPGEIYTRQALTEGGSVRTWKKCHECVPGEDGFCASVRPEDCWGDDEVHWSCFTDDWEPNHGGAEALEDVPAMRMRSVYDYENVRAECRTHESYMIPLVGMTGWREVESG